MRALTKRPTDRQGIMLMSALAVLFRGRLIPWWPLWWNELVAPASLSPVRAPGLTFAASPAPKKPLSDFTVPIPRAQPCDQITAIETGARLLQPHVAAKGSSINRPEDAALAPACVISISARSATGTRLWLG